MKYDRLALTIIVLRGGFIVFACLGVVFGIAGAVHGYANSKDFLWPIVSAIWAATALQQHLSKP